MEVGLFNTTSLAPLSGRVTEVMKGIEARWRDLSAEEKAQWEKKSLNDKDR